MSPKNIEADKRLAMLIILTFIAFSVGFMGNAWYASKNTKCITATVNGKFAMWCSRDVPLISEGF